MASEPDNKIAKTASEYNAKELLKYSISHAERIATTTAIQRGLKPATKPTATPTRAEWANVSLIIEYRFKTTKVPLTEARTAINIPTKKALCINSYSNISNIWQS